MRFAACLASTLVLALNGGGDGESLRCPVDIQYAHYEVSGATLGEIKRAIRQGGLVDPDGRRRYARTEWRIQWSWGRSPAGEIDPSTVRVICKAKVTLPQLESSQSISPEELARWEGYRALLEKHELNHVRHVEAVAPEISRRIAVHHARFGSVSAKSAQGIAKRVLQEIRALDRSYDRNTRHGATEGV